MRPAWSVLLLTTLLGAGQGLFLVLAITELLIGTPMALVAPGTMICLALLGGGLLASFFHLGRPERAWRSAAMWRTSWLSREVIVLPAFMAVVFAWGAAHYVASGHLILAFNVLGIALALALFVCTGMIYACLKFLQEWHTALTPINYTALGCASGLTLAAALAAWLQPPLARPYAAAALLVGALAYALRLASLLRNSRLRPKSTLATAIGVKHPRIAQIAQGAMGGSFNTREFFHGRTAAALRNVKWLFLLAAFVVPAALLAAGLPALLRVRGLGPAKAAQFAAVLELARRSLGEQLGAGAALTSPGAVRDYLRHALGGRAHEVFVCLFMDAQHRVTRTEELFRGSLTQTSVYPREVVKAALSANAAAVIFAHNHPSGVAEPSAADRNITRRLVDALALVDIRVLDHVIIGDNQAVSFAQRGLL